MSSLKHLLDLRRKAKRKQTYFVVKESYKISRIGERWRLPRGKHSGARQMHKGKPAQPTPGYGSPRAVRGLHSSGLQKVMVHTPTELLSLDPQKQGAILGSTLGNRKRLQLLQLAVEKKIRVLNVKDASALTEQIKTAFSHRQQQRKENLKNKSLKEEDKRKKAEEKKKKEEKEAKEEKNKGEEGSIEQKVKKEQEEQKELAQKTFTKRQ